MSREAVRFHGTDTSRSPSAIIWGKVPVQGLMEGSVDGIFFRDDFMSFPKTPATTEGNFGQYAQFSSTGGTIANSSATTQGGEVAIGSDGDDEGCGFRTRATPFLLARTTKVFAFEARVKTSTIADTKHGIFLGLIEDAALTATVPIAADGTLADQNFVGFHRLEGDGDQFDTVYKANGVTQVTVQADAITLVADTYVKVGMLYTPSGDRDGSYALTFYKDGARLTSSKLLPSAAGTDFPNDVALGLVFAVLNATGTTPGTSTLDWWQAAQLI